MDDELAEDRAFLLIDDPIHFCLGAKVLCGATSPVYTTTNRSDITCQYCRNRINRSTERVASPSALSALRDRLGLLPHETAWQVLQRLTWLWQSTEAVATINQAIDDTLERKQ